jgi:RNA polymerase sigma factor (sigma-70 family)
MPLRPELLARLAAAPEDREAWDELYRNMWPFVFATNYRLLRGQREPAEDISQEVFLRLQRYCPFAKLQDAEKFRHYLYAMCRNTCYSYYKQLTKLSEISLGQLLEQQADDPDMMQQVESDELLRDLASQLGREDRRLLRLLTSGYSLSEISGMTGLSYSSVGVRVYRLRRRLRQYFERPGQ